MDVLFVVLFIVLCQFKRGVETRAISEGDSNSITEIQDTTVIRIPKSITEETSITINGTFVDIVWSVALLDELRNQSVCEMTFDVDNNTITVASEFMKPISYEYNFENNDSLMSPTYTLRMEARVYNGQKLINLYFEAENAGEMALDHCQIENFINVERIIMRGVDTITSLLFKYKR